MKFTRVIVLAAIVASAGVSFGHAQSLKNADEPAEFPPASYKGTQYVDSRGCVYVRAGISGNVTWVPRVTRSRRLICGQTPSLSGAETAEAPVAKPVDAPVQITLEDDAIVKETPDAAAVTTSVKPVAKPKVKKIKKVAAVAAAPKAVKTVKQEPVQTAAVAVVAPAPKVDETKAVAGTTERSRFATACLGVTASGQEYLIASTSKSGVRCGPQTEPYYGAVRPVTTAVNPQVLAAASQAQPTARVQSARQTSDITGATRVVPKHVYDARQDENNLSIPEGYRSVWNDGRLNPKRAEQSLAGQAMVKLVWTQTVPRRLVDTQSGRDVTASTPLVYPYVDQETQSRDLGSVKLVTQDGKVLKRIRRNARSATVRQPVVSTRSAAPKAVTAPTKAVAPQFIQVGTFGKQAFAQSTAKKVKRLGLPVRIGKYDRSGTTYRMVLAGPFGSNAAGALAKLKAAGYEDAFLR